MNALSRQQVNFESDERMDISDFMVVLANILADHQNFNQTYFDDIPFTLNATTVLNSNSVSFASTSGIMPGMLITGTGIPINTFVASITSSTAIVITQEATASNTGINLSFSSSGKMIHRYVPATTQGTANAFILNIDRPRSMSDQEQQWLNQQASNPTTQATVTGLVSGAVNYIEVSIVESTDNPQARAFWNTSLGSSGQQYVDTIDVRSRIDESAFAVHSSPQGYPWIPMFAVVCNGSGMVTSWFRVDDFFWRGRPFALPAASTRNTVYEYSVQNLRSYVDMLSTLLGEMKGMVTLSYSCATSTGSSILYAASGDVGLTYATEIAPGMAITGSGISAGTIVLQTCNASDGSIVIVMSQPATANSASVSLTFNGYADAACNPWSSLKLLREYQNVFFTTTTPVAFNNSNSTATWESSILVFVLGRNATYTLAASNVTLSDGECAYVAIPSAPTSASLTLVTGTLESLVVDQTLNNAIGSTALVLFYNKGGILYYPHGLPVVQWPGVVTGSITMLASKNYLFNPPSSAFTGTFPAAASNPGAVIMTKNIALGTSFTYALAPNGSDQLEGMSSATLNPGDVLWWMSDGVSTWWNI